MLFIASVLDVIHVHFPNAFNVIHKLLLDSSSDGKNVCRICGKGYARPSTLKINLNVFLPSDKFHRFIFRFLLWRQERLPHLWQGLRKTLHTQNPLTDPQWRAPLQVFVLKDQQTSSWFASFLSEENILSHFL